MEEALTSNKLYYNVNDNSILGSLPISEICDFYLEWYSFFIEKYIPLNSLPKDFTIGYRGSAQFLVHKSIIKKLPKRMYEDLYLWIITTEIGSYLSGRFLEWTWHVFWDIYPNIS
jgi:hypothetical protein